jgi:glycosyltransferase involved in cell wall biosynthesis
MLLDSKNNINPAMSQVTIGIPVYNGGRFIVETLQSIKDQSYPHFECHVVNNMSTDNTQELVEAFIKDDNRFFLHNYDSFVDLVSNWNRTVNHISEKSTYFKVVQADDVLMPNSLKSLVELMDRFPNAGIGTSYRMVGTRVVGFGIDYFDGPCQDGKKVLEKHLFDKAEITGSITQLFFRISHLKMLPFFPVIFDPQEYHVDARLAYEMFFISDVVIAFEILNYTRRHDNAETSTTVGKYNTLLHGKESRLRRFMEYYPGLQKKYNQVRRKYAYFLWKSKVRRNKNCVQWHDKFLIRKFSFKESIQGIMLENRIGAKFAKRFNI